MRKVDDLRLHGAGVEPRNIEQRAKDFLDRVERGVDVADELRVVAAALPLDQAGDIEPRRIERLQDVVARGGQEAGLGDIGLSASPLARPSSVLRRVSSSVRSCTRRSSDSFARFELFGRLHARRDVGEGGDDAAVRHGVGAHLHDQIALGEALQERLAADDIARDAFAHELLGGIVVGGVRAALQRRISSSPVPTRVSCGGSARISPNCRFQQTRCRSLSNTAMPWRTWSSAVCRISRL